ncbi:hypothetical protein APA_3122 [Pseudanabaena sp. lw0831]|nr:hypothetical protein APA_3122 [Pseudanabaena sp. lw0831]
MILYKIYPTLTLPLQRGGNKISSVSPKQELWVSDRLIHPTFNCTTPLTAIFELKYNKIIESVARQSFQ